MSDPAPQPPSETPVPCIVTMRLGLTRWRNRWTLLRAAFMRGAPFVELSCSGDYAFVNGRPLAEVLASAAGLTAGSNRRSGE